MSDFTVTGSRNTSIGFLVTVTRDGAPVDLTLAGTRLIATGKLNPADEVPLFVKDYYQAGGAPHGGITVGNPNPTNVADVEVLPADLAALTKTSYVLVDVVLWELSGRITKVAEGVLKVRVGPGT